jgi:FtsP/CotA-like multicopper oxidase with cupredoxin domain
LLEKPVSRPYVFLAPGERIELWSDFSGSLAGDETALISLPFDGGGMGHGMIMGGRRGAIKAFPTGRRSL